MQVTDEELWDEIKATLKPVKRKVRRDLPKPLRVIRVRKKQPETLLDLHGLTVQQAFESTTKFIKKAHCSGMTKITIITGRGTTGRALIKNEFEGWLNHPSIMPHIRSHTWENRGGAIKISLKKTSH